MVTVLIGVGCAVVGMIVGVVWLNRVIVKSVRR